MNTRIMEKILDFNISFFTEIESTLSKAIKGIGLLRYTFLSILYEIRGMNFASSMCTLS